jgi:Ger(x)C family germination protein
MAALLLLTGCWDAREVNELSLATMIILDKLGDEYTFTLELPTITPIGESGSYASKCVYLKAIGKTFPEVRDDLENQLEKPLYLGTFQTLMVTERAARDEMAEYMLRMRQDPSYRQRVIMVVTRDEPEAFTQREDKTSSGGGSNVDELLTTIEQGGRSYHNTTSSYVDDILNKRGFVVHCIGLKDKKIVLAGYSVFRDAKCVGFIPAEEARGLIWLVADNPMWHYRVPFESGFATTEVRLDKKRIVPSYENGNIRFILQVDLDAVVQYVSHDGLFPLTKTALNKINAQLNDMIHQELQSTVDRSQKEFQSDYLFFCEAFRIAYPIAFDKMDWEQVYSNAQIEVRTNVDLKVTPKMDLEPS